MSKRAKDGSQSSVSDIRAAHADLDRRVKELDRRAFLTPSEQQELAQLKKKKLILKDQINSIN